LTKFITTSPKGWAFEKGGLKMIIWHGFNYGYDEKEKAWYVTNRKTGKTEYFSEYTDALEYVETHRA
jgi:hypothetical protein